MKVIVCLVLFFYCCDGEEFPKFFFSSYPPKCSLDSPSRYADEISLPSTEALIQEGRAFFGRLLDELDSSLEDPELNNEWDEISRKIITDLEKRKLRISAFWLLVGTIDGMNILPWEKLSKDWMISEILGALGYEYVLLEATFKTGTREILNTIRPYFRNLAESLEKELLHLKNSDRQMAPEKLEETIEEMGEGFAGKLFLGLLNEKNKTSHTTIASPLLEEVALVLQAYRDKRKEIFSFWEVVSQIFIKKQKTPEEILEKYVTQKNTIQTFVSFIN